MSEESTLTRWIDIDDLGRGILAGRRFVQANECPSDTNRHGGVQRSGTDANILGGLTTNKRDYLLTV